MVVARWTGFPDFFEKKEKNPEGKNEVLFLVLVALVGVRWSEVGDMGNEGIEGTIRGLGKWSSTLESARKCCSSRRER
jgi:hypothetical protein